MSAQTTSVWSALQIQIIIINKFGSDNGFRARRRSLANIIEISFAVSICHLNGREHCGAMESAAVIYGRCVRRTRINAPIADSDKM